MATYSDPSDNDIDAGRLLSQAMTMNARDPKYLQSQTQMFNDANNAFAETLKKQLLEEAGGANNRAGLFPAKVKQVVDDTSRVNKPQISKAKQYTIDDSLLDMLGSHLNASNALHKDKPDFLDLTEVFRNNKEYTVNVLQKGVHFMSRSSTEKGAPAADASTQRFSPDFKAATQLFNNRAEEQNHSEKDLKSMERAVLRTVTIMHKGGENHHRR